MGKVDFKKELKHLYRPAKAEFSVVDVPTMQFLMVDGHGDPNVAQAYAEAVERCTLSPTRSSLPARSHWTEITSCRLWKGCGGRKRWLPSPPRWIRAGGIGR